MRVPTQALVLGRKFEGLRLRPYRCPANVPTIGYGHVIPSMEHPPITKEQAEGLLQADMLIAMLGALKYCPRLASDTTGRRAAITDFVFNLGAGRLRASTLRRRINEGDWVEAHRELQRWVYAGARKLPGLVMRRQAEGNLL